MDKLIELVVEFLKKLFDDKWRRVFCAAACISCGLFYVFINSHFVFLCVGIAAGVLLACDVISDKWRSYRFTWSVTGRRARKKLDGLDDESKRIVRDIYKAKSQSVVLLDGNGAKAILMERGFIFRCSSTSRPIVAVFGFYYALHPWVRLYIDSNLDWLDTVPQGSSEAVKAGKKYERELNM